MMTILYLLAAVVVSWGGMLITAAGIGGLPFILVAAVLAGLKLAGVIAWPWWWAMLPLWGAVSGTVAKMWIVTRDPMWRFR
jgi:hypothetical protein